jgi:hypothetical protein
LYLCKNLVNLTVASFFSQQVLRSSQPTKRAPDAGDSAASQAFSPLSSFFYTPSGLSQLPSAGNANRWAAKSKCKIVFDSQGFVSGLD